MKCPTWTRGRAFSLKDGGRARRVSACSLVRDNSDDSYLRRGLARLKVGSNLRVGGGAAPLVTIRRVK